MKGFLSSPYRVGRRPNFLWPLNVQQSGSGRICNPIVIGRSFRRTLTFPVAMLPHITSPSMVYAIGSSLTVHPANHAIGSSKLTLRIARQISVGYDRVSQVFTVEILEGTVPKTSSNTDDEQYVVKLFDSRYATSDDPWQGGPKALCARQFDQEVECYRRLESIQGINVPILHGVYTIQTSDGQSMPMLVMQYLSIPSLFEHALNRPLARDRLSKLEVAAFSALAALHSRNVFHNDIHCGNVLWELDGDQVWFVDFGHGVWPRPELDINSHRGNDEACLRGSLRDLGWVDPQLAIEPPCMGITQFVKQFGFVDSRGNLRSEPSHEDN